MASHPPIFAWRDEIDFTNSVTNAINDLFNNRNSFLDPGLLTVPSSCRKWSKR
jgi:hypothetical protein